MSNATNPLAYLGITAETQHWNPSPAETVEMAVKRGEGQLTAGGPFLAITAPFTGRSPKDKFLVKEASSEEKVWWGSVNRPIAPEYFSILRDDVLQHLSQQELFVRDLYACADPAYRLNVRLVSESAWHTLFAHALFRRPSLEELATFAPDFTILHAPNFQPDPARHGTRKPDSGPTAAVLLNFAEKTIIITGTKYAGEIKKSIFTVLNYLLPNQGVLSMHCSANSGADGETALFFGLSGTGKTTLSADASRGLIGDDEHGWSENGIFNFEGGCYAKTIRLSAEAEPEIYGTLSRFGSVLENVVMDERTRVLDLDSDKITENTRVAYPIDFIPNHVPTGRGDHPKNIIFLSADAFGVLPPVSRLTREQAKYYFLSGYTAKLAGTERGVTEPEATFSTCFGSVFMVHYPHVYADMLGDLIDKHNTNVWLLNTGWSGGGYGVGSRMKIGFTRAMVRAILDGSLAETPTSPDPIFGLGIPASVIDVPAEVLNPRNTWADKEAYDKQAHQLATRFQKNFGQFAEFVSPEVVAAGPQV
jgi:phosphoenolpyruvate carboxykinase (ATP)